MSSACSGHVLPPSATISLLSDMIVDFYFLNQFMFSLIAFFFSIISWVYCLLFFSCNILVGSLVLVFFLKFSFLKYINLKGRGT